MAAVSRPVFPVRRIPLLCACLAIGFAFNDATGACEEEKLASVPLQRQHIPLYTQEGITHHKSAYYGQVSVGGPERQVFNVVFDTGSGHLVLPSTFCREDTCRKHNRFRRKMSETARDIDVDGSTVAPGQQRDQITVGYGSGEVTGVFMQDQLCLRSRVTAKQILQDSADPDMPSPTKGAVLLQQNGQVLREAKNPKLAEDAGDKSEDPGCFDLRFIAATHMSENPFGQFEFDGVLGMGLPNLSQTASHNALLMFAQTGAKRIFSIFLAAHEGEESDITFGGFHRDRLLPPRESSIVDADGIAWSNVYDPALGYWQINVFGITVDGHKSDFCTVESPCSAIVDTGTSLLGVPGPLLGELLETLTYTSTLPGGACDGPGPALEIDLGNFTVLLEPKDFARREHIEELNAMSLDLGAGASVPTKSSAEEDEEVEVHKNRCIPMLMEMNLPEPLRPKTLILGEPVLQRYYAVFDAGDVPRVGFGEVMHMKKTVSE
jgi:hypothetical protein